MPHPKVLGFRARYFAVAYGIFFIFFIYNFENVIFQFWPLPEKLLDCPKKKQLFCPTLGGGCSPPSSYAYVQVFTLAASKRKSSVSCPSVHSLSLPCGIILR